MNPVLIVGLGSYNGDDQIGWIAVEKLKKRFAHDPSIKFLVCDSTGLEWVAYAKYAKIILMIDAVESDAPPGTIHRMEVKAGDSLNFRSRLSTHGIDPIESIELAHTLGDISASVVFWGIELEQFGIHAKVSAIVQSAMNKFVDDISEELEELEGMAVCQ